MAIYTHTTGPTVRNPLTLKELPVYGSSRLGIYYKATASSKGTYAYQLTDHLGNVRAVVMKTGSNALSLTNKTDYYPFGMAMPDRNVEGGYRYGYQGEFAEKDPETGMEAFELRLWDARIGRWLNKDPFNQFYSPYIGLGNNPIIMIDPDGGKIIVTQSIAGNDISYEYRNGKFYDVSSGKLANPSTDYFNAVKGALSAIESSGDFGNSLIKKMVDESVKYEINFESGKHHTLGGKVSLDLVAAGQITMAVDDKNNPFQIAPLYIVVAHELGHAFLNKSPSMALAMGNYAGKWKNSKGRDIKVGGFYIPKSETFASEIENVIRRDKWLPQRAYYSYEKDASETPTSPIKSTYLLNNAYFTIPFQLLFDKDNGNGCNCLDYSNTGR